MKRSDFIYGEVSGDGACFFHSIAWVLTMEGPNQVKKNETLTQTKKRREKLAKKLRRDCVHWLEQNLDTIIPQLGRTIRDEIMDEVNDNPEKYRTITQYLNYMMKPKSWAGQIEIYALSHKLNRSIRVFIEKKKKFQSAGLGYMIHSKDDLMNDIHLFHNSGTKLSNEHHFDGLFPKKKAKALMSDNKTCKRKRVRINKDGVPNQDDIDNNKKCEGSPIKIKKTTKRKKTLKRAKNSKRKKTSKRKKSIKRRIP
tara:strand:+ start:24 stop:785 length:762 start_codon:yes stop_codon:yes gene_type:complete